MMLRVMPVLLAVLLAGQASAQDVIVDNSDAGFTTLSGSWSTGSSSTDKYGSDYRYASTVSGSDTAEAEWRPNLPSAGLYEVSVWYPEGSNRAPDAPFTIEYSGGSVTAEVDQSSNGGMWRVLDILQFAAGASGRVVLGNSATSSKVVLADAVRFRKVTTTTSEFRGIWVSRYEWPSSNANTMRSNLRKIMQDAARGHFNAVVLQVRGQADVLYPSPYEPWSPECGGQDPGFDPLRFALDEAHARGLTLHAYFNTHVAWDRTSAPSDPSHVYFDHCNPNDPAHRDWLVVDDQGEVRDNAVYGGYLWLAPGIPEMQAYLRQQVMHLVNTYPDLDGIHFDRIRTVGSQYSHDSISEARLAGPGNPASLSFGDWTRDQITRFLRDTYAEVRAVNPTIEMSAAPGAKTDPSDFPGWPTTYHYSNRDSYQDSRAWMEQHVLDWISVQAYWHDGGSLPDFSPLAQYWTNHQYNRYVYMGMNGETDVSYTEDEIQITRNLGMQGNVYWYYGNAEANDHFTQLAASVYSDFAATPELTWAANPTTAIVYGYVTDQNGQPVTDAWITYGGSSYTALSSADGLYSFIELPPGSYTLSANKTGLGSAVAQASNLTAGEVRRVDIVIAPAGTPVRLEVASAPGGATQGQDFQVTVRVVDSLGNTVTGGSWNVELAVLSGTGSLAGTVSGATSSGVFTFTARYDTVESATLEIRETGATLTSTLFALSVGASPSGSGGGGSGGGGSSGGGGCALTSDMTGLAWLGIPLLFWSLLSWKRRSPRPARR